MPLFVQTTKLYEMQSKLVKSTIILKIVEDNYSGLLQTYFPTYLSVINKINK